MNMLLKKVSYCKNSYLRGVKRGQFIIESPSGRDSWEIRRLNDGSWIERHIFQSWECNAGYMLQEGFDYYPDNNTVNFSPSTNGHFHFYLMTVEEFKEYKKGQNNA